MKTLKNVWNFLNDNIITFMLLSLILTSLLWGFKTIQDNKNAESPKIYSLIEGEINGKKTYLLILTDSIGLGEGDPVIVVDSSHMRDINDEECVIKLNGTEVRYKKSFENLRPLVKNIERESGYKISGVIGKDSTLLDSLNTTNPTQK